VEARGVRFTPISGTYGRVQDVRFRDGACDRFMTDMGAKPPILTSRAYVRFAPKPDLDGPASKGQEGSILLKKSVEAAGRR